MSFGLLGSDLLLLLFVSSSFFSLLFLPLPNLVSSPASAPSRAQYSASGDESIRAVCLGEKGLFSSGTFPFLLSLWVFSAGLLQFDLSIDSPFFFSFTLVFQHTVGLLQLEGWAGWIDGLMDGRIGTVAAWSRGAWASHFI